MAYMDVKPTTPNGRIVILLHGKNYVAATWQTTIAVLNEAGFRVIAPDQIGFGKSTKPAHYQYTFQQLAGNTHALLASLGISRVTVVGILPAACSGCATRSCTLTTSIGSPSSIR